MRASRSNLTAPTFFVLCRPLDARHRPWKGSLEATTYDAAEARLRVIGRHRQLEAQIVASTALRPDEIDRYRAEIANPRHE